MHTVKKLALGLTATALLAFAPASHAQSAEDLRTMQTFLDIMTSYFQIIESSHAISSDHEKSAIMHMQKIQEVYEERGEKARTADVLRQVLEDSRNPTIRSAANLMLGDILKESGRADEAIEVLRRGLNENIEAAD
ncbi:MAG: hypothetical protein QNJ14_13140 [Woeseiaceae bacterium]|nr:hypothetical protein [Woeseiaceae bacterium]